MEDAKHLDDLNEESSVSPKTERGVWARSIPTSETTTLLFLEGIGQVPAQKLVSVSVSVSD